MRERHSQKFVFTHPFGQARKSFHESKAAIFQLKLLISTNPVVNLNKMFYQDLPLFCFCFLLETTAKRILFMRLAVVSESYVGTS